jgi:hypothetical protein
VETDKTSGRDAMGTRHAEEVGIHQLHSGRIVMRYRRLKFAVATGLLLSQSLHCHPYPAKQFFFHSQWPGLAR